MNKTYSYKEAGVDVEAGNAFVNIIKPLAKKTHTRQVLSGVGGFSGLFKIGEGYRDPVLVATTDGVGTKLKMAFLLNRHNTVGIDLVAMCINDLITQGATPLFFLDYMATGKLDLGVGKSIIEGIVEGCHQSGCALLGGETAEMPDFYKPGEYDLAGFAVGIVEKESIIDGYAIETGDVLIGLPSSGLHSNGYSLVRKVLRIENIDLHEVKNELGISLADELLKPTRIYAKLVLELLHHLPLRVKGIAHITGGGLTDNLPRILPDKDFQIVIKKDTWTIPPIFTYLQGEGHIPEDDFYRTFNTGIGLVFVVSASEANEVLSFLDQKKEPAYLMGEVTKKESKVSPSVIFI